MKAGWEVKPLGEVCDLVGGGTPSKKVKGYYGGSIPWVTVRDMNVETVETTDHAITELGLKNSSSKIIPKGEIIIASRVGLGKVCKLAADMAINQDLKGVIPKRGGEIDRQFLFYWFQSIADFIEENGVGATVQGVKLTFLNSLEFPFVPLEEQKRIVVVLDAAFEGLTRAKENAEANLQNARELFENTVNTIILTAPNTEKVRSVAGQLSGLLDEQKARKNDKKFRGARFSYSRDEPTLPVGWIWSSPEQLCSHIVDCLHTTPKWTDSGEICLRTTNFRANELDMSETRYVSPDTYAKRISRLEPKPKDVLYSREGGILGIACLHPIGMKACLGQRMMQFRLRSEYMIPEFFCAVLNSGLILREVRHFTGGAAAPHLNIGDIRQFPIPVPPISEQESIVRTIARLTSSRHKLLHSLDTKLTDIADLRQSLLQKAFAGELT